MGRAEPIRMLLTHAQVNFIDERISFQEFDQMKKEGRFEFGQLPALVWPDGTYYSQSQAILRALGIRYGYYPSDIVERYQVDSTLDAIQDIFDAVAKCYFGGTDEEM